jgi:AcrR family transcriptional regulator
MEMAIDRRSSRTRSALHRALISLILQKGYDAITIQEIIDEADVGRATFYAHYRSKEDLLRGGFAKLRAELEGARNAGSSKGERGALSFSLAMFEHACAYRDVYRALVGGRGGPVALAEMRRVLSEFVSQDLSKFYGGDEIPRELAHQFVIDAFLTVLKWCLEKRPKAAPEQAEAMFSRLVMHGVGPLLRTRA